MAIATFLTEFFLLCLFYPILLHHVPPLVAFCTVFFLSCSYPSYYIFSTVLPSSYPFHRILLTVSFSLLSDPRTGHLPNRVLVYLLLSL
jgi:hypothetical protein